MSATRTKKSKRPDKPREDTLLLQTSLSLENHLLHLAGCCDVASEDNRLRAKEYRVMARTLRNAIDDEPYPTEE